RPHHHAAVVEGEGGSADAARRVEGGDGPVGVPDEPVEAVVRTAIVPRRHAAVVDGLGGSKCADASRDFERGGVTPGVPYEAVDLLAREITPPHHAAVVEGGDEGVRPPGDVDSCDAPPGAPDEAVVVTIEIVPRHHAVIVEPGDVDDGGAEDVNRGNVP